MELFNTNNNQRDTAYNMTGRTSNTTYADDVNDDRAEYMPSSYANTVNAEDDKATLLDIQNRLGTFGSTVVDNAVVEDSADAMPSQSTMSLRFARQYEASQAVGSAVALNAKTKVIIASYAMVTLLLIAAIAVCAVTVGSSFTAISAQEAVYTETLSEVSVLQAAVASVGYEQMLELASELGYSAVDSSSTISYTVLETRPAQNYEISSNWFDSLCDWVSGAFGG